MALVSKKSKSLCILLAIVGNCLLIAGLHRFYARRYLSGTIMFFTFGGFLLWTVIDVLQLLCNRFKDAEKQVVCKWLI